MRKLSEVKMPEDKYAACCSCGEVFIDDVMIYGALLCPCRNGTLLRGMTAEEAQKFKPYRPKVGCLNGG